MTDSQTDTEHTSSDDVSSDWSDELVGANRLLSKDIGLRQNPAWHFVVVTTAFMIANVFAPYTLTAGWAFGSFAWVFSIITTWISGVLIGKCVLHGSARGIGSTYPEMMAAAFGQPGYIFTLVAQIGTYYMLNVANVVNVANWLLLAFQAAGSSYCLWKLVLFNGILLVAMAQIRTFKHIMPFAIISLASTLVRQILMYYQISSKALLTTCSTQYSEVSTNGAFASLATTALMWGGHGIFPEEMRELRRPESFIPALHVTYVICIIVYVLMAYVAYYVWGDWTAADVQFNWPLNEATMVSAALSWLWGSVNLAISHVMMFCNIERTRAFRLSPSEEFAPVRYGLKPWLLRLVLRTAVVISEVFLAFMLADAGIGNLQGVVGALGFTALTYYCPYLAYWKLISREQDPLWLQTLFGIGALLGIVVMIVGVYVSVAGIAEEASSYGLFNTSCGPSSGTLDFDSEANPCRGAYGYGTVATR